MTTALFVCRRPPWPMTNGARIRSHRLAEGLAEEFDTILLTMDHEPGSPDGHVDLDEVCRALPAVEVRSVPGLGSSKRLDQVRGLPSGRSWSFGRYATAGLRDEIARISDERSVDLIHADDLGAALALPTGRHSPRIRWSRTRRTTSSHGSSTAMREPLTAWCAASSRPWTPASYDSRNAGSGIRSI